MNKHSSTKSRIVKAGEEIGTSAGTGHGGIHDCYENGKYGECTHFHYEGKKIVVDPHNGYKPHLHFEIAYCSKGSGNRKEYYNGTSGGKEGWGNGTWVIYDPAAQVPYVTDKNDPRLSKGDCECGRMGSQHRIH